MSTMSQAVETFGNVDAGCRAPKGLSALNSMIKVSVYFVSCDGLRDIRYHVITLNTIPD